MKILQLIWLVVVMSNFCFGQLDSNKSVAIFGSEEVEINHDTIYPFVCSKEPMNGIEYLIDNGDTIRKTPYENGYKHGFEIINYSGVSKLMGYYNQGKKVGEWKLVNSRTNEVDLEINYDTIPQSQAIMKWEPTQLCNGYVTFCFPNGKIRLSGNFLDGRMNGEFKLFYENGNLCAEGAIINQDRIGKWTYYNEIGEITEELDYGTSNK